MIHLTLHDLYVDGLRSIYEAERHLHRGLPLLAQAARLPELKTVLEQEWTRTSTQIWRIEQIFAALRLPPYGVKCPGIDGLLEEAKMLVRQSDNAVLDAAIIGAMQKLVHYQLSAYQTIYAFADALGGNEAADGLRKTLTEERDVLHTLAHLFDQMIQQSAPQSIDYAKLVS